MGDWQADKNGPARTFETEAPASVDSDPASLPGSCASCGAEFDPADDFCTSCGSHLHRGDVAPVEAADGDSSVSGSSDRVVADSAGYPGTTQNDAGRWRGRRSLLVVGPLILLVIAGATAAGIMAAAWHSERSSRRDLETQLASKKAELVRTNTELARTKKTLAATESLSARKSAILDQTSVVLRRVDPLLSDVDRLQQVTGDIQAARDVFSGHANTLVNDMIALGNALIDFANNGYDPSYLSSDIDNVNIEIQQVRGDVAGLTSHDSDYADASKTFGNDADSFTQSVRRLQRQLKGLPKQ